MSTSSSSNEGVKKARRRRTQKRAAVPRSYSSSGGAKKVRRRRTQKRAAVSRSFSSSEGAKKVRRRSTQKKAAVRKERPRDKHGKKKKRKAVAAMVMQQQFAYAAAYMQQCSAVASYSQRQLMQQQTASGKRQRATSGSGPAKAPTMENLRCAAFAKRKPAKPVGFINKAQGVLPVGLVGGQALGTFFRKAVAARRQVTPSVSGMVPEKLAGEAWEQPREEAGLKLLGASEGCPPGVKWDYVVLDESRRSFAGFAPGVLAKEACDAFFERVRDGTIWMQPHGPFGPVPRKTAWLVASGCSCSYRYGGLEVPPQAFPPWMVELMKIIMPCCGLVDLGEMPNSCNMNLYEDGSMSVGWHSDDEALFQGKFRDCRIISLSLGARRRFELRLNWPQEHDAESIQSIYLVSGDLCTMEGMMQKHFQHRIAKEMNVSGARINLTWRWIAKHDPRCPAGRSRLSI